MAESTHTPVPETPFVNGMRLSARQWILVGVIVLTVILVTPPLWKRIERFETGPDYRIPFVLSKDYWLYERRLQEVAPNQIVLVGDSVVWGEYVLSDGTLSHFLNAESGQSGLFVNAGVNGLFPLALEGLVDHYGGALRGRKVLLHCNLLWLSSPKADLQTEKEERFNHARLVPQFMPRIPCYKADINERLGAIVERNSGFIAWTRHLQNAYFDQKSIPAWTLADDGGYPTGYPNSYRNPLAQITLEVPGAPPSDPERGPESPRHKPWSLTGEGTSRFEWVSLESSLQWAAFQRLVALLRERGNDVLVVVGPFNEHIMAGENLPQYRRLLEGVDQWLTEHQVAHLLPEALPSTLYGDASHPLTGGYQLLAQRLQSESVFRRWAGLK